SSFSGGAVASLFWAQAGGAPEVLDLRRLRVQPTWPFRFIKSFAIRRCLLRPKPGPKTRKKKMGVRGEFFPPAFSTPSHDMGHSQQAPKPSPRLRATMWHALLKAGKPAARQGEEGFMEAQRRLLITGGAGNVATLLRPHLRAAGYALKLLDRRPAAALEVGE